MANYLTFKYLDSNATRFSRMSELNESRSYGVSAITVFLSHRHTEEQSLINKVRGFLYEHGAQVYIDWQDKNMPVVTNGETASRLKQAIKASNKFIVLATPKSIESIWIPWELGLADQMKGYSNITLLPIVNEGYTWDKREYYNLYSRIAEYNGNWLVIEPQNEYHGTPLEKWLRNH